MAGDWIKMRLDLQTHPKIVRILSATGSDKFRVIGGLHAVWSVFDTHSTDGRLDGYTVEALGHIIGWPGFAKAMVDVGWLVENDHVSLALPEFDEHNGASGKRRAEDQKRKRNDRKSPQPVRNLSADEPDKLRTREEKKREEGKSNPVVPGLTADDLLKVQDEQITPPASGKPDCPHRAIIALYHDLLPQCPEIRDWTTARQTALRARWNEDPDRQSLAYWRRMFEYVATCDFLVGRAGKTPFFANLEWIVQAKNFAKIRERHYENRA